MNASVIECQCECGCTVLTENLAQCDGCWDNCWDRADLYPELAEEN